MKKRMSKKNIIALVVSVCIISAILSFLSFKGRIFYSIAESAYSEENYIKAINYYEKAGNFNDAIIKAQESKYIMAESYEKEEDYASAASLYEEIKGYKDSDEKLNYAKWVQTNEGQFILAVKRALITRWNYNETTSFPNRAFLCSYSEVQALVDCELDILKSFKEKDYEREFAEKVSEYIETLEKSRNSVNYPLEKYHNIWNETYNNRIRVISYFADKGLKMDNNEHQKILDSMLEENRINIETKKIEDHLYDNMLFDIVYDKEGLYKYTVTVTNNSDYDLKYFRFEISLYDNEKSHTFLEKNYSNEINNFQSGEKAIFTFYSEYESRWLEWQFNLGEHFDILE